MSFEEDTELRDLVIETLEKKGVLGKIKAELRATVFLALEDSDFEKCKIPLRNEALQKFMETEEGPTVVALVRDFLETFNLAYTLAVFDPEVSRPSPIFTKNELETRLHLEPTEKDFTPLLQRVLSKFRNNQKSNDNIEKNAHDTLKNEKSSKSEVKAAWLSDGLGSRETLEDKENLLVKVQAQDSTTNDINKDDTLGDLAQTKEPLIFGFLGNANNPEKDSVKESKKDETFLTKSDPPPTPPPNLELGQRKQSASSLSSLQDLPSLSVSGKNRKGSLDYEDDFQSSLSQSVEHETVPQTKTKEDIPDDGDGSVEEEIEEDFSVSADDILNSGSSRGDDLTSDQTVSRLSGKNPEVAYSETVP